MVRTFFAAIVLLLYLIIWLPLLGILLLVHRKNPQAAGWFTQKWATPTLRLILLIAGCRISVRGIENIPRDRAVLFAGNHKSIFDIVLAIMYLPVHSAFIAKKELAAYPIFAQWAVVLDALFMDRKDLKQELKTVLCAIDKVKNGSCVFICPEGTRDKSGDPLSILPFKEGSLKIAEKSGCPVVPVAFYGTDDILERHFPSLKPCHVSMEFGKPFYTKDLPAELKKKSGEYTREIVLKMLREEQGRRNVETGA
jgi:1-acyl-sn-glycerol-3-phosphate acyltransferase